MKRMVCWSIVNLILAICVLPLQAQDTVRLKPYTDNAYSLTGVIPDGWHDIGSGTYERAQSPTDVTVILQQSIAASPDEIMTSLLPRLGLTTAPEIVGTHQSAAFKWTLYKVQFQTPTITVVVDLALAGDSTSGRTYFVSLQTSSADYDLLHKTVFLPVLDTLKPYEPLSLHDFIRWLKPLLNLLLSLAS